MRILTCALLAVSLCCIPAPLQAGGEVRQFTNKQGQSIQASVESISDDKVTLLLKSGKSYTIPISSLSQADQDFLKENAGKLNAGLTGIADQLNQAAGHQLFTADSLFTRPADEIASALKLKPESKTDYSQSWRLYAAFRAKDYTLFGAMPYSIAMYADAEGNMQSLSAVFANKGDFGQEANFGPDHFLNKRPNPPGSLQEAMDMDDAAVHGAITPILGEPKKQRYGEGKARRWTQRWDWNGLSILLSTAENEYVTLSIVPTALADSKGKTERVKDEVIKAQLEKNLSQNENGDVLLKNIPMVNQGPKGYCVPATFERAMRYMGIEADMYLLAMIGETNEGGGTSVSKLVDGVKSQVYSKGRRTKDIDLKNPIRIRDIKRYIDQGAPLMWRMCSTDKYNELANNRTKARQSVTDWAEYAKIAAEESAPFADYPSAEDSYHICMIIGYNETTGEIAVSDSWGPRYEVRWIHSLEASPYSKDACFIILP
ncbi:C39 family peptidase [Persicirhabdus sediminis]|uniref:C39 family peptidase n=1 Tax=Persicirhabdus sediminis TaxID=454144 RepID=A0A8J7MD94_9BACT|nr:C39 family peptidase [Persicirhabdus sediminis]MBK1790823.1 C39 family peptidase [Persicirhabdus sediminis]